MICLLGRFGFSARNPRLLKRTMVRLKFCTFSMRLRGPKRLEIYSIMNQNLVNPPCAAATAFKDILFTIRTSILLSVFLSGGVGRAPCKRIDNVQNFGRVP